MIFNLLRNFVQAIVHFIREQPTICTAIIILLLVVISLPQVLAGADCSGTGSVIGKSFLVAIHRLGWCMGIFADV